MKGQAMAKMTKAQQAEQDEARERLRELFPAGSTVTVTVDYVARSGMSRSIRTLTCGEYGPTDVSHLVARAVGWPLHKSGQGVKVDGCGMDMGFHLVYTLAYLLHGDGYALATRWL